MTRIAVTIVAIALAIPQAVAGQAASDGRLPPRPVEILKEVPMDWWHFLSLRSTVTLGLGGAAALIGHTWDDDLAGEVETSVRLNDALAPGHTYGAFHVQAAIGIGAYALGHGFGRKRMALFGADIIRAQVLSQSYAQLLKVIVQRERPDESDHFSFPSGHSASGFATAGVFRRHFGWKAGVPAYIVAGYVATARVKDNRHYLSDVMFGAAIGIASSGTIVVHPIGRELRVSPTFSRRHASVVFNVFPLSHIK